MDFPPHTGVIIETPGFIPHYSGYKNLKVLAELNGKIDRGQIIHTMELVGLNPNLRRPIKNIVLGCVSDLELHRLLWKSQIFSF